MDKVKVKITDQFDREYIATAVLNKLDDKNISIFRQIDHIVIDDEIILPNIDLFYESQVGGKIYKVDGIAE